MDIRMLTDEQLAGQRIMAGFNGTDLNDDLKFLINKIKVGGIILFSRNIETPDQVKNLCVSAQNFARSCGQPPLFIAIDQEGGLVARLRKPLFKEFPGNPAITSERDAIDFATACADELKNIGINMNMAPVMDVALKDINSIMKDRAFGDNPERVSQMGSVVINRLQQNGIIAVSKHFPGIGRTVLDSHLDLPPLDVSKEEMQTFDLPPFMTAIKNNVSGIMLSHILYKKLDENWPASLSPIIARDLLRKEMGYNGVSMTDDMDMGAIKKHYNVHIFIAQILKSEIDLILICHKGPNIMRAYENILHALTTSKDMKEKGILSVRRLNALKEKYLSN
ncbi:MAG: beta-N-acetylhexosaminidase [Desulfobacterales bacterium]|nr:beta-N-acetylhexosaminidase [Desulfobacterales bacterium]